MELPLIASELPDLPLVKRGATKDVFALDDDHLLLVCTDRVRGTKDSKGATPVLAGRGRVLHAQSTYWFNKLGHLFPHHLVSSYLHDLPARGREYAELLDGRSMVVKKALPFPFTCIVCGYLGVGVWDEYRRHGTVLGYRMPEGMSESQRLPSPLFGVAVKPAPGCYGKLLNFSDLIVILGRDLATEMREAALRLYMRAWKTGWERGILLAEGLFAFGMHKEGLVLIDECLTTDSSRFWARETYQTGGVQTALDRHIVLPGKPLPPEFPFGSEVLFRLLN